MPSVLSQLPSTLRALEFRRLWRTLLHGMLVGVVVGVAACVFFYGLEHVEHLLLHVFAGFRRLRPAGEHALHEIGERPFRPWLLALMPALPLDEAGKYVAAAYIVFVVLLLVYIAIMAWRLGRISSEIEEIAELSERRTADSDVTEAEVPAEAEEVRS